MSDEREAHDLEALRECVARNPGAPEFPALAEAERREGRAEEAVRIARRGLEHAPGRMAGHVSLALALLDLGEADTARAELSAIIEPLLAPHRRVVETVVPVPAVGLGLADDEIERAIDAAEARPEEMVSPNRMAERVLLEEVPLGEGEDDFDLIGSSTFSTPSMARLLERQGDLEGARGILRSLEGRSEKGPGAPAQAEGMVSDSRERPGRERRGRIVATLERWLDNLQRGAA
jgi:hypothetical protein